MHRTHGGWSQARGEPRLRIDFCPYKVFLAASHQLVEFLPEQDLSRKTMLPWFLGQCSRIDP